MSAFLVSVYNVGSHISTKLYQPIDHSFMSVDVECINYLLLMYLFLSTPNHHLGTPVSTLDLAVISGRIPHKWKWVYTNDPWLFDSTSVRLQNIYSHWSVFTQVPWSPASLSVGLLASINGIHQWPVIRWCFIMLNIDSFIHMIYTRTIFGLFEDLGKKNCITHRCTTWVVQD